MKLFCKRLWQDTQGQDLVEYALMAGMVAVAAVAVLPQLNTTIGAVFTKLGSIITSSMP
jgi:pilus assembly protein Flp/PilA